MKKSISYWAFPGGLEGTKDVAEAIGQAAEMGYDAIELGCAESGELGLDVSEKRCAEYRAAADKAGIEISSLCSGLYWGRNFGSSRPEDRAQCAEDVKRMLQIAAWLGVDALLYIPAAVDVFFDPSADIVSYEVALERSTEGTRSVLPTAEKHRVALCIENVWSKFLLSPTEMARFIDGFGSEYVGAYFDVGNVLAYGYPEQWIRILGSRIKRVHFKDFKKAVGDANGFCDLLEGDVNWPEVMKALREVGYDGYCTAEMIPLYAHHPLVRVRNTGAAMDAILGRA